MYNNNYNWYQPPAPLPGKHEATVAMVLGIVSCALLIFGYTALGSIVTGIIGLIYASRAKSLGFIDHSLRSLLRQTHTCLIIGLANQTPVSHILATFEQFPEKPHSPQPQLQPFPKRCR